MFLTECNISCWLVLALPWVSVRLPVCLLSCLLLGRDFVCVCVCMCAHPQLLIHVWLFVTLWTITHQAPLSTGILRQEYWSGLPFPSPGESSWPRDEHVSPVLAGRLFTTAPIWTSPHGCLLVQFQFFVCSANVNWLSPLYNDLSMLDVMGFTKLIRKWSLLLRRDL